jgi:hypothetical protein
VLVIVHSGQTGVERGAHRAAIAHGLAIAGFMPLELRDELGPIPADIAALLTPHLARGPRQAVLANVQIASGVLLVVRDAARAHRETGMAAVLQAIRDVELPHLICDPMTNLEDVARWAHAVPESSGSTRSWSPAHVARAGRTAKHSRDVSSVRSR